MRVGQWNARSAMVPRPTVPVTQDRRGPRSFTRMQVGPLMLLLLLLGGCASQPAQQPVCRDHLDLLQQTRHASRLIDLRVRASVPSFYLISGHYVIFMEPADVVARLQTQVSEWNVRADRQLLEAIQADVPLARDTDLRSYGFADDNMFYRPEYVVAALLESGAASVIDIWDLPNGAVRAVAAMTLTGMGEWRDFCAPNGDSILFITDLVVD